MKVKFNTGDVRFIAYPEGRPAGKSSKRKAYSTNEVADRKNHAEKLADLRHEGRPMLSVVRSIGYTNVQGKEVAKVTHLFNTLQLQKAYKNFPRYSTEGDSIFNSTFMREGFVRKHSLEGTIFNMPSEAHKILKRSMQKYFKQCDPKAWSETARNHFEAWSKEKSVLGYKSFSQLACAVCGKHVLGVPDQNFSGYSTLWNDLLAPLPQGSQFKYWKAFLWKQKVFFWDFLLGLYPRMEEFVSEERPPEGTLLRAWQEEELAEKVAEALPYELKEEIDRAPCSVSLHEKILVDNLISVLLGMQETVAFVMTEACRRLAINPKLQQRCRNEPEMPKKLLCEVLRWMAPAGGTRQLLYDTDMKWEEGGEKYIYRMNAGEAVVSHPSIVARNPAVYENPDDFNVERKGSMKHCPFGSGPHRCPGEPVALDWMVEIVKELVAGYTVRTDLTVKPEYLISFTMKHEPDIPLMLEKREAEN